jgi:hypothetical protein
VLDNGKKQLRFRLDGSGSEVTIGELIPQLLILGMDKMMYMLKIDVNAQHRDMEVVGFGKSDEEKRYVLFIKI